MSVPESVLEVALLAEAPEQWKHFQRSRLKRLKGLPKWKRDLEEMDSRVIDAETKFEEFNRQYDPELMRINSNLERKIDSSIGGGLRCPTCDESDRHNRMNDEPWCLKCNVALESPFLVKKRLPDVKMLPKTKRLDVTFRGLNE